MNFVGVIGIQIRMEIELEKDEDRGVNGERVRVRGAC
ncbi:hypothetical protein L195_g042057, partial [Trifolium pratense]